MPIKIFASLLVVLSLIGLLFFVAKYLQKKAHKWRKAKLHIKGAYPLDTRSKIVKFAFEENEYTVILSPQSTTLLNKKEQKDTFHVIEDTHHNA